MNHPDQHSLAVSAAPNQSDYDPKQININVPKAPDNRRNKVEFGAGKLRVARGESS